MFFKMLNVIVIFGVFSVTGGVYLHRLPSIEMTQHQAATWSEAQHRCLTEGTMLASPLNNEFIQKMMSFIGPQNNVLYFIGIKEFIPPPRTSMYLYRYLSVEGHLLEDMPVQHMYSFLDATLGDCLAMNRYRLYTAPCDSRLPYICYSNVTSIEPLDDVTPRLIAIDQEEASSPKPVDCGEGYKFYPSTGSCYKRHNETAFFEDAQTICQAEGGYLVILNDEHEVHAIKDMYEPFKFPDTYVGLRSRDYHGDWRTLDVNGVPVEQLYNVWRKGPKPIAILFDCAVIMSNGRLDNGSGDLRRPFLCEKNIK